MNAAIKALKQVQVAKCRRQYRLIKGRFENALRKAGLSLDLQDSALREFERVAKAAHPEGLPW